MDKEEYAKKKPFAGPTKPSMLRRRIGHDYQSRRVYLITIAVEGRRHLLGRLVGDADAPSGTVDEPRVEPSELGLRVQEEWFAVTAHHPEVTVIAFQLMPDHLHGILFVQTEMAQHLGMIIKGFKASTNKHYRRLVLHQPPLPSAATASQQNGTEGRTGKRDRSLDNREHGLLWELGYNDHILEGYGELDRWKTYLHDNPRRLAVRRAHPDFFRVRFGMTIGGHSFAAIGNRFLLSHPQKLQVQCSRSLTEEQRAQTVEAYMAKARKGTILVSPAISKGEQQVMRAALDAHLPLIFLTPWGFNTFSRPGHQYYEACAEGRFLILAPWEHQNQRIPLTRAMCLELNQMAKDICDSQLPLATTATASQ